MLFLMFASNESSVKIINSPANTKKTTVEASKGFLFESCRVSVGKKHCTRKYTSKKKKKKKKEHWVDQTWF